MTDSFRANRQFERFIFDGKARSSKEEQEYDLSEDEVVATLVYDRENRTVTIVYPEDGAEGHVAEEEEP
jgi:hypothetical protein